MALRISDLYAVKGEREKHLVVIDNLGSVKDYPVDMLKKDGSIIHTIYNTVVRKDINGKIIGYQGTIRDITAQKIADEELKKSEAQLRLLVDYSFDLIWNITDEGVFTYISPSWKRVMGYLTEEVIGKNMSLFIHPDDLHIWQEHLQNSILTQKNQTNVEYRTRHKDGSWYWHSTSGTPVPDQNGKIISFVGISRNINEQKEAEEKLLQSEENLKITLLSVGDGVITTDRKGKVTLLNKVAEKITGWTSKEAYDKPFEEIFRIVNENTQERCERPHLNVFPTGKTIELSNHTILISKDGNAIPIEDTAAPIRDGEGNINGMVLVFRDCSEKRKKQQRIEFLSFRDSLTGLYNRRFFEEELKRMNVKRNLPISLVIADVNGLKLANDAFGHAAGDMLLQKAAKIMKRECRADDVIARIGGDEFVILLPKTDYEQASLIVKRMNENMAKEKMLGNGMPSSFILSISFGWDTKHNEREDMAAVFKRAEDNMYRRKLSESTSMRNETIRVIIKTLYEKSEREQQHSVEVSQICQAIGEALELSIESKIGRASCRERVCQYV
jgi:diguanylate cyclase (GGDEF)-like protein/PAS domain S-box-containing protein